MKKESIIVGIFGLSLGLLVAWAIWNFKSAAPKPQEISISPAPMVESAPTPPPPSAFLTLDKPQDEETATESSILVAGRTKPGSTVVIAATLDDYVLTVDQNGSFTKEVDLEEGENLLTVTSYGPDDKEETVEKSVIYSQDISPWLKN